MDLQALDAVVVGVITGLVSMAKQLGMHKRFAPILSVILGIAGGIVYIAPSEPEMGVLVGLVMGLSSVGLYSGSKTMFKKSGD